MVSQTAAEKEVEAIQSDPSVPSETSSQFDDTYDAYKRNQGIEVDAAEIKRVLRKIDFRVVPILFFIYLLQYLDKNGINYASAYGLSQGTKLKGQDFSWLGMKRFHGFKDRIDRFKGSIFYFGYLAGQYPSGYLLQRLPIAKFLGFTTLGKHLQIMWSKRRSHSTRMGHNSYDYPGMQKFRWYRIQSLPSWST